VIAKKGLDEGQFVQPGQRLFVMVPDGKIWVKLGADVNVKVDAYPRQTWKGKVESISPSSGAILSLLPPENASGNYTKVVQRIPVVITVEQKPGMSVNTTIIVED